VDCWLVDLLRSGVDCLGSGEDVESEVAAAFGPFVVLFGEDGADEADDAGAVGEAFFLQQLHRWRGQFISSPELGMNPNVNSDIHAPRR
jgi:hypothetical protein